ncbi:clan AA aspartic protease [Microcoleus sp. F6_B4]
MINLDRDLTQASKNMGAVRVKVKLTNAIDEELVKRGLLNPNLLRVYEAEALIDSGAVRTAIPVKVCEHLGLRIRSHEIAKYADGRQETVGLTGPIIIELGGRETIEAAMVLGDMVLIGKTVLETLDFLVDCQNQRLVPNPENPERPVLRV